MASLARSKSYARFLRRFGLKHAAWLGDYCRFREVGLIAEALVGRPVRGLLDVGCAGTLFPHYAAFLLPDARVVGIDSEANLALAPERILGVAARAGENERVRIFAADARSLPFPDAAFEAVTAISVLEHIRGDGDRAAVREMLRVLRPGGLLALSVPMAARAEEHEGDPSCPYFIRRYDDRTLAERLIDPAADARLIVRRDFGERRFPYSHIYMKLRAAQERWLARGAAWKPLRYGAWAALAATPLAARLFLRVWDPADPAARRRIPGGTVVILEKR